MNVIWICLHMPRKQRWVQMIWIWTPKQKQFLYDRGVIADGNVQCVSVWWFVYGRSFSAEEFGKGLDGAHVWMAFGGTAHTLSCYDTAARSTEYQPAAYGPHGTSCIQV